MQYLGKYFRPLALATVALIGSLSAAHFSPRVALADDWCFGDPVVSINNQNTQVVVGIRGSADTVVAAGVTANIVVTVPDGVSTSIVTPPPTGGAFVETLSVVTGGTYSGSGPVPVKVQVTFTSATKLDTSLQVTWPTGSTTTKYGNTNGTLTTVDVQFSE